MTPLGRKEPHASPYYFGCYLVGVQPYKEGRFFKKEYIFDSSNNHGKSIFVPNILHTPGYLHRNFLFSLAQI